MSLPELAQLEFGVTTNDSITSSVRVHSIFDWDFINGDFKLVDGKLVELTGLAYLKVWIQKILMTEKNSLIYAGTDYGSEHYSLIGQNFNPDFTKAEMERMIFEALLQNDAIISVDNFEFVQEGSMIMVSFDVDSIYGTTNEEVKVVN